MKLFEQDYFVIRNADGSYYTGLAKLITRTGIDYAPQYNNLEEVVEIVNYRRNKGIECEIIPIRVTITEIKKRELLCYFMNPIFGNGWDFRADESMKYYWKTIVPYDGYGALTD